MDERHAVQSEISHSRERLGDLAEELSRRVSPPYLRGRAKEMAMTKSYEWKDRAVHSPKFFQLIGAAVGWILGSIAFRQNEKRQVNVLGPRSESLPSYAYGESEWRGQWREPIGADAAYTPSSIALDSDLGLEGSGSDSPSLKDRASDMSDNLKAKASDVSSTLKEKAADASTRVRARASETLGAVSDRGHALRERTSGMIHHARDQVPVARERVSNVYDRVIHEQPLVAICSALAIGSILAMLLPVTQKERQVLSPAKDRVKDQLQKVGDAVESKVSGQDTGSSASSEPSADTYSSQAEPSSDLASGTLRTPAPFH